MSNLLIEKKELALAANTYNGGNGHYGIMLPVSTPVGRFCLKWYSCREEFANYGRPHFSGFFFYHSGDGNEKVTTTEDIAEFIDRFETLTEQGRRRPLHRTTFQKVTTNGVINKWNEDRMTFINAGPFWTKQPMRHQLLTLLLRCANYGYTAGEKGDFHQALYHTVDLAMNTKSAISRFLDGYTWYTGDADCQAIGWHHTFRGMEGVHSSNPKWKILIKPKKKESTPTEAPAS